MTKLIIAFCNFANAPKKNSRDLILRITPARIWRNRIEPRTTQDRTVGIRADIFTLDNPVFNRNIRGKIKIISRDRGKQRKQMS